MLSIQIHDIDYTLSLPGVLDRSDLPRVPVIRVYGQSSLGLRTCVHVHQVFPYCFIEYPGKPHPRHAKRFIRNFKQSLNHAIALSLKRDPHSPKSRYIRAVILVKGVKFYGFNSQHSPFLKILLADPGKMSRVAAILQSGSVMSQRFQVYESHLSYILQFMCDFGLYGCGSLEIQNAYKRDSEHEGDMVELGLLNALPTSPYPRQSRLPVELDIISPCIMNRTRLVERPIHHSLQIPEPPLPPDPLVISVRELWEDERNRRRAHGLDPSPELPNDPTESSRNVNTSWISEARWWEAILSRLEKDRIVDPQHVENGELWESQVMSVFESIEALWDTEWRTWQPIVKETTESKGSSLEGLENVGLSKIEDGVELFEIDVNENILTSTAMEPIEELEQIQEDEEHNGLEDGQDADNVPEDELEEDSTVVTNQELEDPFIDSEKTPLPKAGLFNRTTTHMISQKLASEREDHQEKHRLSESSVQPTNMTGAKFFPDLPTLESSPGFQSRPLISSPSVPSESLQQANHHLTPTSNNSWFTYSIQPPTAVDLTSSWESWNLPNKIYRPPFYSKDTDLPDRPSEYAGLIYSLKGGKGIAWLDEFQSTFTDQKTLGSSELQFRPQSGWEYGSIPPGYNEIRKWCRSHPNTRKLRISPKMFRSQIEGPTQSNIYGFKNSPIEHVIRRSKEGQSMTLMSLEVLAPAHDTTVPDPDSDAVCIVVYAFQVSGSEETSTGIIAIRNEQLNTRRIRDFHFDLVDTELDLLNRVTDLVVEFDPDIITGWEVQRASWGYLNNRSKHYGFDFQDFISRAPLQRTGVNEQWTSQTTVTLKVAGRHVLNAWRIMRSEQALTSYTLSNVAFHILQRRIPQYSFVTLSKWYSSPVPSHMAALLRYLLSYVYATLQILEATEIVTKTAEFARIFGVDFYSVISRGSQFKVESFMFRIAKPENYVLLSPSKEDVGKQNAAECMPLIMEPMSAFYNSPLVVLDFQSLYPSVMIAYNYCYSTCLGRIAPFQGKYKFGVTDLELPSGLLEELHKYITVAPNGIMYVKPTVRKGLLGRMLVELLETRVMVKHAMKGVKTDKALTRVLNARQLALKYIANVTYGYTSATFSGRMPAVEIADSIVQSGRETLEKSIEVINGNKKWGAKVNHVFLSQWIDAIDEQVVYGDTDSLFVYLPGKTREQAFRIGNEMANVITSQNPVPIKLKFEKVYHPCVLMAKKRYVGFKYESIDDKEPTFDAKGIETVRRDGVPAQRKLVENCLKILFRTQDLSEVKDYCCRSWYKILENRASIQDFIYAKEVKMGTYSDKGPPPPGAVIAGRKMVVDPNSEPQYGERVPYVITRGDPGALLAERAFDPLEVVNNPHLQLDANYYITRVLIPPLERVFNLVGADVRQWFAEMPKAKGSVELSLASPSKRNKLAIDPVHPSASPGGFDIEEHFRNDQCLVCGEIAFDDLCESCMMAPQESLSILGAKVGRVERKMLAAHQICTCCSGIAPAEPVECEALDCAWFYARKRAEQRLGNIRDMLFITSQLDSGAFDMPILESGEEDAADSMEM